MSASGPPRWRRVAALEEIPPRGARVVTLGGDAVALFRASDDRVFALRDRCPHRGGPLSQGIVHGHCVTCPLHDWVIDLESGEAKGPDEGATASFDVRVEGRDVWLAVSAAAAGTAAAARPPETVETEQPAETAMAADAPRAAPLAAAGR